MIPEGREVPEYTEEQMLKIMDALNIMGREKQVVEGMVVALRKTHRTLQQNFWRAIMAVIKEYAEFNHDLRNEGAVELCKYIKEQIENKEYLPFI